MDENAADLFRMSPNPGREDVVEAYNRPFGRWEEIFEFQGWIPKDREQMILAALNGNSNLCSDWIEMNAERHRNRWVSPSVAS